MEKKKNGRPRSYLRLDAWNYFLNNDWLHLNLKLGKVETKQNFIIAIGISILGVLIKLALT